MDSLPGDRDTIAAIATPPGVGGIGIIRVSGSGSEELGQKITNKKLGHAKPTYTDFVFNGELIDQGIAMLFRGPRSFTGEDVLELQGHGGPVVMKMLLEAVCALGARVARPGEFSERAFLNEKIDLAQAEAISDLISSASVSSAKAAIKTVSGAFSEEVENLTESLNDLRVLVEANLDFSDEEIEGLDDGKIISRVGQVIDRISLLINKADQGMILNKGVTVALLGQPNVGKSSLFNRIADKEESIVTELPGTTRDLIKTDILISGLPIRLVDTAGLRDTEDKVEKIGVKRARVAAENADLIIEVKDLSNKEEPASNREQLAYENRLVVYNKRDLRDANERIDLPEGALAVSAVTGLGIDLLRNKILERVGFENDESVFTARIRHIESMRSAVNILKSAELELVKVSSLDLLADHLRQAQNELTEILGSVTSDELLGKIFSEFCIGK